VRKGSWTAEEDARLVELVSAASAFKSAGAGASGGASSGDAGGGAGPAAAARVKWRDVAASLPGRLGKQCRERWFNQLDPAINMGPWSVEEDQKLLEAQRRHGNRYGATGTALAGTAQQVLRLPVFLRKSRARHLRRKKSAIILITLVLYLLFRC
jgi:hypothetical protein